MNYYKIGKLNIISEFALSDAFEPFRSERRGMAAEKASDVASSDSDISIIIAEDVIDTSSASFHVCQEQFDVWKLQDAYAFRYRTAGDGVRRAAEMQVDAGYTTITVMPGCGQEYLIRLALECRMVKDGFVSLHSACVVAPDGNAVCMTGASGVGKSTRVAAWKRALGLEILSGDRPMIDVGELVAGGAPWDGKEGLHKNVSAPLGCIINVVRADGTVGEYDLDELEPVAWESRVRVLDKDEAYKVIIAQTYMPMWDTDLAAGAMASLKNLCERVKVMELVSGPDEESAVEAWKKISKAMEG